MEVLHTQIKGTKTFSFFFFNIKVIFIIFFSVSFGIMNIVGIVSFPVQCIYFKKSFFRSIRSRSFSMRSVGRNTLEVNNTDKNYTAHCSFKNYLFLISYETQ